MQFIPLYKTPIVSFKTHIYDFFIYCVFLAKFSSRNKAYLNILFKRYTIKPYLTCCLFNKMNSIKSLLNFINIIKFNEITFNSKFYYYKHIIWRSFFIFVLCLQQLSSRGGWRIQRNSYSLKKVGKYDILFHEMQNINKSENVILSFQRMLSNLKFRLLCFGDFPWMSLQRNCLIVNNKIKF